MRTAIRYSEYKSAGKLPHRESFDCSTCYDTPTQEKRNCQGLFGTKYQYTIGTMQYDQCPVSVYCFDPDVITVIDLCLTSLESGIPVAGHCLLDQTKAFFDYVRIIRDERNVSGSEIKKLLDEDAKKAQANARRTSAGSHVPRRRR